MPIFTQNSLQYTKRVSDEIVFPHVISMEVPYRLVMIFDGDGQTVPKFPKCQVCNVFTIYISKKKLEIKLTFYMEINIKVSYKFISKLWATKLPAS